MSPLCSKKKRSIAVPVDESDSAAATFLLHLSEAIQKEGILFRAGGYDKHAKRTNGCDVAEPLIRWTCCFRFCAQPTSTPGTPFLLLDGHTLVLCFVFSQRLRNDDSCESPFSCEQHCAARNSDVSRSVDALSMTSRATPRFLA